MFAGKELNISSRTEENKDEITDDTKFYANFIKDKKDIELSVNDIDRTH